MVNLWKISMAVWERYSLSNKVTWQCLYAQLKLLTGKKGDVMWKAECGREYCEKLAKLDYH